MVIRYDIPWRFKKIFKDIFLVESEFDLNDHFNLIEPIICTINNTCCYEQTDSLEFTILIPQRGWVIGDTLPITIEVKNNTRTKYNEIRLNLLEMIYLKGKSTCPCKIFIHDGEEMITNVVVCQVLARKFDGFESRTFQTEIELNPNFY